MHSMGTGRSSAPRALVTTGSTSSHSGPHPDRSAPTGTAHAARSSTARIALRIGAEAVLVDIADRPVADRLVDLVRGRVCEIGEEEDELPASVELVLAGGGSQRARVAATAALRRGVDGADANAVRRLPARADERDHGAAVLPDVADPPDLPDPAVGRGTGIGDRRRLGYGLGRERDQPVRDELAVAWRHHPPRARRRALGRDDALQAEDPFGDLEARRLARGIGP